MDFIQDLNNQLGNLIGVTFFDPQHFISLVIRFAINLSVVSIIARFFYFPRSHRRDYMFIFILMAQSIFLLVTLMEGDSMNVGAALGLFAIFGIMRFHVNFVFICLAWVFESSRIVSTSCSKYIRYDNVNLIAPEKREELKADLEKRLGLKILRVEVGMVDFLKDSCMIRIFYDEPLDRGNSIEELTKMPRV